MVFIFVVNTFLSSQHFFIHSFSPFFNMNHEREVCLCVFCDRFFFVCV